MGPDERSAVGWFNTFIDINCSRLQRYANFLIPTIADLCHIAYHLRGIRYLFAFFPYILWYCCVPSSSMRWRTFFPPGKFPTTPKSFRADGCLAIFFIKNRGLECWRISLCSTDIAAKKGLLHAIKGLKNRPSTQEKRLIAAPWVIFRTGI